MCSEPDSESEPPRLALSEPDSDISERDNDLEELVSSESEPEPGRAELLPQPEQPAANATVRIIWLSQIAGVYYDIALIHHILYKLN